VFCSKVNRHLIFFTYEFKLVLALTGYNYFAEFFGETSPFSENIGIKSPENEHNYPVKRVPIPENNWHPAES